MSILYGLVGASGFGSEVMPILESSIDSQLKDEYQISFIDIDQSKKMFISKKVMSEEEFFNTNADIKYFNIAISNPKIRYEVYCRFSETNAKPISIFSNDVEKISNVSFAEGPIILPHVLFTTNISVGKFFHSNPKCSIAHDVKIGDFVTLAPGAIVNGNVFIDDFAYIGSRAVIKQGVTIGKGATIGMGAVVIRDVEPGTTVVGNPAKILEE